MVRWQQGQSSIEYFLTMGGALVLILLMFGLIVTITRPNLSWVYQQTEKTPDEQVCDLANVDFPRCYVPDTHPPGEVANFNISYTTSNPHQIFFTWIWPADDGVTQGGKVARVELVYVHDSLTTGQGVAVVQDPAQFNSFLQSSSSLSGRMDDNSAFNAIIPPSEIPGTYAVMPVQIPSGFSGTYYFGIRAVDDGEPIPNYSGIVANAYVIP